jgi:transposase-like protein
MAKHTKPFCKKHNIPMVKKGTIKEGEERYKCLKCEAEK